MNYVNIIYAVLILGSLGLIFGILLGYASQKFQVKVNEKIPQIRAILPGANCGGCGFPGCDAFAAAIVEEGAPIDACIVGGAACASKIAYIMGLAEDTLAKENNVERKAAFVKCKGDCNSRKVKIEYEKYSTCAEASKASRNDGCSYGCAGLGCCVKACKFDAITIENGVAVVDEKKCTNCGMCIKVCPKKLIEAVPVNKKYRVACSSEHVGKITRDNCSKGCIACRLCEKECKSEAIKVDNNVASIDYSKCINCGACYERCPVKAIYVS